jgi:hypothetical protein
MAIQLATARQSLENVLQDISDVPAATFLQWCQYLSDTVYRITSDIDPERYITAATINVVSGSSSYALPVDFLNHQSFGTGLFKQNSQGVNTDQKLGLTGFGSSTNGYYISGSNFVLTPTPQQSSVLINRYIPKSPTFTSTSDYFTLDKLSTGKEIVPDAYLQYVQNSLVALYEVWDQDAPLESLADQRFVRTLDELARNISRPPLAWSLPDFSQMF